MKPYIHYISSFIMVGMLIACQSGPSNNHSKGSDTHNAQEGNQAHSDEIIFTPKQAEAIGLKLETIAQADFQQVIKVSGQIQPTHGDELTIAATANGIVSYAKPSIAQGMEVRAGETLLLVSSKKMQDGDPNQKARIAFDAALKEYQRAEVLIKDTIIPAKEFEQIRLRYETAKTTYEALANKIGADGVKVTAPTSGYVKNMLVGQGEYVSLGQAIMTLSQNKRLQLRAEVSERHFKFLRNIGGANFSMAYDTTVYKMGELNGRLLSVGQSTSQQSPYIPVTFEFNNVGGIIPGSFAEVYLLSQNMDRVISVPVSALTEEQGLYFVYLQLDQEGYKKQEVSIGPSNGKRIQVLTGLKEGDKVVVHGVYQVKLAATSSVIPEGHTH